MQDRGGGGGGLQLSCDRRKANSVVSSLFSRAQFANGNAGYELAAECCLSLLQNDGHASMACKAEALIERIEVVTAICCDFVCFSVLRGFPSA